MQADSDDQDETRKQTEMMDQMLGVPVDVYDVNLNQPARKIGFRGGPSVDAHVGTDQNKNHLSGKDWYYSDLHRSLLHEFCK